MEKTDQKTELGEYVDKYNSLVEEINGLFKSNKFSVGKFQELTKKRDKLKRKIIAIHAQSKQEA